MLLLIFNKKQFHTMECIHVKELREKQNEYVPGKEESEELLDRINKKRKKLIKSLVWVCFLVALGSLLANYINISAPLSWFTIRVIRSISIVLIAWSVFSRLQDIETMKGITLLETTNLYLYKWFYSFGVFLASFSLFLEGVEIA